MNNAKKKFLFFIISISLTTSFLQAVTEQDLIKTYQDEKAKLEALLSQIAPLQGDVKDQLSGVISNANRSLDLLYTSAENGINPYRQQLQSTNITQKLSALGKITTIVDTAQQEMAHLVSPIVIDVTQKIKLYIQQQGQGGQQKLEQEIEEQKRLRQAQEAYRKKMDVFVKQLSQLLQPFDQATEATREFSSPTNKISYDSSKVGNIVSQWQTVADRAFAIYQQMGPISVNDNSNLLIASLKNLSNFLLNIIVAELKSHTNQKYDDAFLLLLNTISLQLLGDQQSGTSLFVRSGYDSIVKNSIAKYFTDPTQQAVLYNAYSQRKINITYNVFKNVLITFANTITNPTDVQRLYITNIYNLLMSELSVVKNNDKKSAADMQQINESMALIYLSSAQSLIKTLQVNQDNEQTVLKIIDLFRQAVHYFSLANQADQVQAYTAIYTNLTQALTLLKQAQVAQRSSQDFKKTIDLYKQVENYFIQGSDLVDANRISIQLADLQGKQSLATVKNVYDTFFAANKSTIQNYIDYCTNLTTQLTIDSFGQLFQSLIQLYQDAYASYTESLQDYQTVLANNPALKQSNDIIQNIQNITVATTLLTTLSQAQDLLNYGDKFLQLKTIESLQEAETIYYKNAITLFGQADLLLSKNPTLENITPPFFTDVHSIMPQITFKLIAQWHCSKLEMAIADSLTDPTIALAFYTNANNRYAVLPAEFQSYLTKKRTDLSKSKDTVDALFSAAQKNERDVLALSKDAWAPQSGQDIHSSDAINKWENVLQQYLSLYHLGYTQAKAAFIAAVQKYYEAYKANVPEEFFPNIGLSLLQLQLYMLYMNDGSDDADTVLKTIQKLLEDASSQLQILVTSVADQTTLLTTASLNQERIVHYTASLDQALIEQDQILTAFGVSQDKQQNYLLLSKETKDGTIIYTFDVIKKSITMPDPTLALADLYKKMGDHYFDQKNYTLAYLSYSNARKMYAAVNKVDLISQFSAKLALSNTLYLAAQYRDLIIPQGYVTVQSYKVPESYNLHIFGQVVPTVISDQFPNLDFLKSDQQKTVDFTIQVAIQLYLYNKIKYLFGEDQFPSLYALVALNYDQLKGNPTFQALSDDQKIAFVSMVSFASTLGTTFKERVAQKMSSLVLQQRPSKDYILYEYNIAIPRFTTVEEYQNYYPGYPAVIVYYIWSANLFKPGPADQMIAVGQASLPHGNDQESYNQIIQAQINAYISQGYDYQNQLNNMQKSDQWLKLMKTDKNDMTATFDTYSDLYAQVNALFGNIIFYYNGPISNSLIYQQDQMYKSLTTLLGQIYKSWGDMLMEFVIGDPLSHNYGDVLKDILEKYVVAIGTYNYDSNLYIGIAQRYTDAGNLLINQNKYYDSLSFFYAAAFFLKRITNQTSAIIKAIDANYCNYFGAMYKGSTLNIAQFHRAQANPIAITLQDGTHETLSFSQLLTKYLSFLSQSGEGDVQSLDPVEKTEMDTLKNLLLDALIYYNGINSQADKLISDLVTDAAQRETLIHGALSMIDTFSAKNNISFDSIDSVNALMAASKFPDGNDFVELLLNGFEIGKKKVEESTTVADRALGYTFMSQLALKLYEAFSYLYMSTFLGGISVDAQTSLTAAIKARANELVSPPDQIIG